MGTRIAEYIREIVNKGPPAYEKLIDIADQIAEGLVKLIPPGSSLGI